MACCNSQGGGPVHRDSQIASQTLASHFVDIHAGLAWRRFQIFARAAQQVENVTAIIHQRTNRPIVCKEGPLHNFFQWNFLFACHASALRPLDDHSGHMR